MQVIIQGRRLEVGDALRRYAERKVRKLSRHLRHLRQAQVVLEAERQRSAGRTQVAEVTVWGDGLVLRGTHRSGDMFTSIDGVVEKLEKQIEKRRSRLIEKRRIAATRDKRRQVAGAEAALRAGPPPSLPPQIVRLKRFPMKPMTAEDAIMEMERLGHAFFVYRDAQTEKIHVLYRRRQGDYGLIEPD
ncbi:MAG: ribosome-associated translation inhibitor RaiA [Armatimonadota bacterium]|nr:ribosome-associated translation inhibitor RaiA [Armatimonadota bacterium]MDR7463948.1 ribosome-associated translation inhibitor RaiA [Armatimonadota bacterium]MDR7469901.1 ribosome-associated translation inhibitor RaiA [Armatimonadota bacterium]MDR7474361.1 ribosome-associated translation inhibitor RaiA [Armatimonadota bacterium]MDR7540214.1 ribosome-associated translation inhibitor RaiA [Armatimonadota bacterium]